MKARKRPTKKHRKHVGHHVLSFYGTLAVAIVSVGTLLGAVALSGVYFRSGDVASVIVSTLVGLTNADRSSENLGTLSVNPLLTAAAQAKADDMAAKGYFAHTSPDGKTSWYWFKQEDYSFSYAGENLAVDFNDSDAVEQAWMNSPTHRANILNAHFTEIGIATAVGTYEGRTTTFVVQMFGTPASAPTSAPVAVNPAPQATEIAVAKTEPVTIAEQPGSPRVLAEASTSTSTPHTAAPATPVSPASPVASFAAAPVASLRTLYLIVGAMVLAALLSVTGLQFSRRHMRYVGAALFLFVLMGGLYITADRFVFSHATLTSSAAAAVEVGASAPIALAEVPATTTPATALPFTKQTVLYVLYGVAVALLITLGIGIYQKMSGLFIAIMGVALAVAGGLILITGFTSWLY